MTYRMVIGQPRDPAFPVADFWFEAKRTSRVPWWNRWRRISPRQRFSLTRDPSLAGLIVEFADETEMYAMQAQLERALDAAA